MPQLNWEMMVGDPVHFVRGGKMLSIEARTHDAQRVVLNIRDVESGISDSFVVRYNINIGGKDYLMLAPVRGDGESLIAARLMDKTQVCAMDRDRFSSLYNAMNTYIESNPPPDAATLAKLLEITA